MVAGDRSASRLLDVAGRSGPLDEWVLVYEGFDPDQEGLREALCTLGNGYFATRGAAPESTADDVHYPGTYIAGCYNRLVTEIAGRAVDNEDIVNVPNWLPLTFRIADGEWFDVHRLELLDYRQQLDLRWGVLTRVMRARDAAGRVMRVTQRRFVHMSEPHLAALETTITSENWSGPIELRSALDGTVTNSGVARYRGLRGDHLLPVEQGQVGDDRIYLQVRTRQSRTFIAQAARTHVTLGGEPCRAARAWSKNRVSWPTDGASTWPRGRPSWSRRWSPSTPRVTTRSPKPAWRHGQRSRRPVGSPSCSGATCSRGISCGAGSTSRWQASRKRSSHSGSTSSTCCRRCRRTPSASTVASPPGGSTARRTAATSSGTSCSSSRCSTCGFRS